MAPPAPAAPAALVVEVRQGVGGEEAALWAATLATMLRRYCQRKGWLVEDLYTTPGKGAGVREEAFAVAGAGAATLFEEIGVHRVQRVSPTDRRGRVHTSAATVAVLLQAAEEQGLDPADVVIERTRASGPGGQHMQKNETAVKARHLPSGLSVSIQDERSLERNRDKALKVLAARVAERQRAARAQGERDLRRAQLGSGDRSERRRTYDFPEGVVVDHRRGVRTGRLAEVLAGDLDLLR